MILAVAFISGLAIGMILGWKVGFWDAEKTFMPHFSKLLDEMNEARGKNVNQQR